MSEQRCRVAIIGTGFSGIGTAIRLKQDGIDDVVLLERAADLGGTWRDNTYPGCACDVPSHLYSFSFARNPRWPHTFSRQPEIWRYLRDCAERFGILPQIRFGQEVLAATWREDAQHWRIETSGGVWTAEVLVSGAGVLSEPRLPQILGIETFAGTVFHSARWDHGHALGGRRVAVIGTGASAIQFVPEIQRRVARLVLFMRTPPWIVPRNDRPLGAWEHRLFSVFPPAQYAHRMATYWFRESILPGFLWPREGWLGERVARRHLETQVADPVLREKLTPRYRMGCKRILISNDFYPALQQANVALVTEPIAAIRPRGVLTADGVEHAVDTLILGTGFNVSEHPIAERIRGRAGRSLAEIWDGSPKAHLGTTVAGFPNLFMMLGPNTANRAHLGCLHDRESDQPRARRDPNARRARPAELRAASRGAGGLRRQRRCAHARDGLVHRRLRQLVHRPNRSRLGAVARLHLAVPPPPRPLRRARVPAADPEMIRPSIPRSGRRAKSAGSVVTAWHG
jgi:cation diffusion facilitator CzcD-associated flavoprotein CzcO